MSYCRFGEADAYIYDHISQGLICCACSLMPVREVIGGVFFNVELEPYYFPEDFVAGSDYDAMLAHIAEHRAAKDYIPEDVDEHLIFDRDNP